MRLTTKIASIACGLALAFVFTGCSMRQSDATVVRKHTVTRKKHRDVPPRIHRHVHAEDTTIAQRDESN